MSKKKILFVYPSSYDNQHRVIKSRKSFFPTRTLPYLAALTPKRYETRIIDELIDDVNFDEDVDLVALTGMIRHMPRAIDIAGKFKKRGIPSVVGGVAASAIRDVIEKSGVFKSLVIGEVDELWKGILDDFDQGRLKKRYECTSPPELKGLPPARFDLLKLKKYAKSFVDQKYPYMPIETSRGCPHNCKFCLVTRYFGKKMRYRPIGEIVEEIKYHGAKTVMFTDDNIAVNPARARELFLAIKPLGICWLGQFEAGVIRYPDLLRLAAESGCRAAFVGVESLLSENLDSVNKSQNTRLDLKDVAKGFQETGITLWSSLIFGMDYDTPETIDWTIEEMIANRVGIMIPWILTPNPGTPCYDEYNNEGRIIHKDYSLYDCWHLVMRPKRITPDELERSFWRGLRRFYSLRLVLLRALQNKWWNMKIPCLLFNLYFRRQVYKGLHPFAGNS